MEVMKFHTIRWISHWYVIASMLILFSAIVYRAQSRNLPTLNSIPNPVMPSPNAWNTFNQAYLLMRDVDKVDAAVSPPKPADVHAHPSIADNNSLHHYTASDKQHLLGENLPAIVKLRQGLNQQYMNPPSRSFSTLMPYYANFRSLAHLLRLQMQVDEQHGNWESAFNSGIDTISLGTQIPHGSTIIGSLVGVACSKTGLRGIEDDGIIDHLTSLQSQTGAERLADLDSQQTPCSEVIRQEKWSLQASLLQIFDAPNWRGQMLKSFGVDASDRAQFGSDLALGFASPRQSYFDLTDYMDELQIKSNLPWPQQMISAPPTIPKNDVLCNILCPVFGGDSYNLDITSALNRLLETQLGLRAYKLDYGEFPQSLSDLAPKYLPTVPTDPFANNQPLIYRRNSSNYLLYSIGPDAKDNGGIPIDNMREPHGSSSKENQYVIGYDQAVTGDIVAGINK